MQRICCAPLRKPLTLAFGCNSGETALLSAYPANVDRALISEVPFDIERLAKQVAEDKRRNPSNYAMVVISEGASMLGGQPHYRDGLDHLQRRPVSRIQSHIAMHGHTE